MTTKQKKTVETVKRQYVKKQKPVGWVKNSPMEKVVDKVVPVGWQIGDKFQSAYGSIKGLISSFDNKGCVWVKLSSGNKVSRTVQYINQTIESGDWVVSLVPEQKLNGDWLVVPPVIEQQPEPVKEKTILEEAQELVYGDREKDYGRATDNFGDLATMWSVIARTKIEPYQVALMMASLKICRYNHGQSHDSAVDLAGYAGILEKLEKGL